MASSNRTYTSARLAAIEEAYLRRATRAVEREAKIEWMIENVLKTVRRSLKTRIKLAVEFVRERTVRNLSVPVAKEITSFTKNGTNYSQVTVTERSSPGEFPRADTTMLMKTIFSDVREISESRYEGYVGTPLDYGLILETNKSLRRSFLTRTLKEENLRIRSILIGPLK